MISGSAGTGKTSLTLALGVSFASSGARTLLIDCDLIGGGLTRRVNAIARRKIGHILRRHNIITREQLEQALQVSKREGRKIGDVIVEMGFATRAVIDECLTRQAMSSVGVMDAIAGERVRRHRDDRDVAPGARLGGADRRGAREPVHARHLDVHQDHVGPRRRYDAERLLAVARLGHDGDPGRAAQHHPQRGAHHRVVVDDGQVVGVGTHETLLATCPTYAEFADSQSLGAGSGGHG